MAETVPIIFIRLYIANKYISSSSFNIRKEVINMVGGLIVVIFVGII